MRFLILFSFLCSIAQAAVQPTSYKAKEEVAIPHKKKLSSPKNHPTPQKEPSARTGPVQNPAQAPSPTAVPLTKQPLKGFLIIFKPALFYYQDKTIRHIFSRSTYMSILEFDRSLKNAWHIFFEAGYARSHSKVAQTADVSWTLAPFTLGLKYLYPIADYAYLYAKAGPAFFIVKSNLDNGSAYPWVPKVSIKRIWGGHLGLGSLVNIHESFYLDIFLSYLCGRDSFIDPNSNSRIKIWAGGLAALLGLGYKF